MKNIGIHVNAVWNPGVVIEWGDQARQALQDCRTTKAGFTDAFMGRINSALGAAPTMTFDRDLAPLSTFRVLQTAKRSR